MTYEQALTETYHRARRAPFFGLGVESAGGWTTFPCPGSSPGWRVLPSGEIEIEGEGAIRRPWPKGVDDFRDLINQSAAQHNVAPAWVAATMALETGGRSLCAHASTGKITSTGPCAQNEGAGLMAVLPSTATMTLGRPVTSTELLSDNALSVDVGTRVLRGHLDTYKGDIVMAAMAYNAGKVRCGTGKVWKPAGFQGTRPPCPTTSWGVVMGCVESGGSIVVNDYPRKIIGFINDAIDKGYAGGPGGAAPPPPVLVSSAVGGWDTGRLLVAAVGVALGYWTWTNREKIAKTWR